MKTKKIIFVSIIITLAMLLQAGLTVFATDNISVYLDGRKITFSQKPYMQSDRVMVPMRRIFEKLGAEVTWNDATQSVTAEKGGITTVMTIDAVYMYVNGGAVYLDVPPALKDDKTFVPLRAVSETFGCQVAWNDAESRVDISTLSSPSDSTLYYTVFNNVPDFGACVGAKLVSTVENYIFNYDISKIPSGSTDKYKMVMTSNGFKSTVGNGYTVYIKDNTTVLVGSTNDGIRVVIRTSDN